MPAVSIHTNPPISRPDDADYEPDDEWKNHLRKRIDESFESMVKEVKDNQAAQLRKEVVTEQTRLRLEDEYKQAMVNIRTIASEQYRMELDRERNQRRWTAGKPINAEWTRILAEEQQSIMNTIKQNQDASPTDERRPIPIPKPDPQPIHDPPSRRRSASLVKHPRKREGSIRRHNHSKSNNTDDADSPLPDKFTDPSEYPPQSKHRPDPLPFTENTPNTNRWESSLGRTGSLRSTGGFSVRPPPIPIPEVWSPTTPSEDDPLKSYHLGRRGSSASMKSTGSGGSASVRPTISATIPERIDDADDLHIPDRDQDRHKYEIQDRPRRFSEKKPLGSRKITRPTPVTVSLDIQTPSITFTDEDAVLKSSTGSSSVVMQMATSPGPIQSLSSKPSSVNGDERLYRDHSVREREGVYRDPPYSSRDIPLSSRTLPARSPYSPEERDHHASGHYSHRPSKPAFRDQGPLHQFSTQTKYGPEERDWDRERRRNREPEIEREADRDDERDYRDYERSDRDYDYRDREWDRDRDNYVESPRHSYPHPSHSQRSATYPTPPSSAPRIAPHSRDVDDHFDDRDHELPSKRSYGYPSRGHGPSSSSPPDDWEYHRLESTKSIPTRQPSYSRRDDPDRDHQHGRLYHSSSSIPIVSRHATMPASGSEDSNSGPSWKEWGLGSNGRRMSESHYDRYSRSPPRHRTSDYRRDESVARPMLSVERRKSRRITRFAGDIRDKGGDRSDEDDEDEENEEQSEGDESYDDDDDEDLEEQSRRLEAEMEETDRRIREKALEIQKLREEEQRLEEEARRKEEDVKRKEEEVRRKDDEAKKAALELQRIEEETRRREEEEEKRKEQARKKEKEMRRKELDVNRKIEDANKLAFEAVRKAEEARKKEDEVNRKEEQTRKKEEKLKEDAEKTKKLQAEANRLAERARVKQESLRQMEQEIEERERTLRLKEEELKRREEETWRKEEEARKVEVEMRKKEQEARKREEEARKREEEARKREEEAKKREEEARKRDDEARKRDDEARKREEDARKREEDRQRRESELKHANPERFFEEGGFEDLDSRFVEEQARLLQQAQYRKREEEIKRIREERKRQDSVGNESAWTPSSGLPKASYPPFVNSPPPTQYTSPSPAPTSASAWTTWGAPSSKSPNLGTPTSARPIPTPSGIPNPPLNKPRNGSFSSSSHPTSASPHPSAPITESEWARRHAEFTNDQQERFRREQERMEAERQLRSAGKPLSREEIQRVFEHHERLWTRLPTLSELTWIDFPWPVLRTPSNPDDITVGLVSAYFSSPFMSEKDRNKSMKERVKDHLRRWHPDRFETKVLTRVVEGEKERVKLGSGNVVRYLNDLLRKENEVGTIPSLFGD